MPGATSVLAKGLDSTELKHQCISLVIVFVLALLYVISSENRDGVLILLRFIIFSISSSALS